MINQQTVLMATPIAALATEKGINLHEKTSDIIKGLNETTASVVSFTEDNIAVDLPAYTSAVIDHTEVMDATTTIVADKIRGALGTISKVIKPIITKAESQLRSCVSAENAVERIMRSANIDMVNVEPAFLDSFFYPKEAAGVFRDATSIRLSDLLKGSYPSMTGPELIDLISLDVPDVQPFLTSPEEVKRIYESIFVEKYFYEIFNIDAVKDGVAAIGSPLNYRFSSFRTMVITSMILNKLTAMEDPLDGVTGISLDEYRTSVRMTRDLLNTMLWHFKNIWQQRARAGIVIVDNELKYAPSPDDITGKLPVIQGRICVGYNNAVLEMFANSDELSLSEYVLGYVYARFREYRVADIITDKETVVKAWREYLGDVTTALVVNKGTIARKTFIMTMEQLAQDENYKPLLETMEDNIPMAYRALQRLQNRIDLEMFFNNITMVDNILRNKGSLMNTGLAPALAGVFDSLLAEEILILNAQTPAATKEQQRETLALSIDKVIVKRLIKV